MSQKGRKINHDTSSLSQGRRKEACSEADAAHHIHIFIMNNKKSSSTRNQHPSHTVHPQFTRSLGHFIYRGIVNFLFKICLCPFRKGQGTSLLPGGRDEIQVPLLAGSDPWKGEFLMPTEWGGGACSQMVSTDRIVLTLPCPPGTPPQRGPGTPPQRGPEGELITAEREWKCRYQCGLHQHRIPACQGWESQLPTWPSLTLLWWGSWGALYSSQGWKLRIPLASGGMSGSHRFSCGVWLE